MDKYSEKEKTHSEIETKKETENRGSAVPLHVKGYPLKLDAFVLTEGHTVYEPYVIRMNKRFRYESLSWLLWARVETWPNTSWKQFHRESLSKFEAVTPYAGRSASIGRYHQNILRVVKC